MKKQMLIILLLVIVFCSIGVSASISQDIYFKNTDIKDISYPCWNNETYCSNTTVCDLTINYLNGSHFIFKEPMENIGGWQNYTITISSLGCYPSYVTCNDNGLNGTTSFNTCVNLSGSNGSGVQGWHIAIFIGILAAIAILLYFTFTLDEKYNVLKLIFVWLTLALFTVFIRTITMISQDNFAPTSMINLFNTIYKLGIYGLYGFGLFVFFSIVIYYVTIMGEKKRDTKRGDYD